MCAHAPGGNPETLIGLYKSEAVRDGSPFRDLGPRLDAPANTLDETRWSGHPVDRVAICRDRSGESQSQDWPAAKPGLA